jgi:hypothetical protein
MTAVKYGNSSPQVKPGKRENIFGNHPGTKKVLATLIPIPKTIGTFRDGSSRHPG